MLAALSLLLAALPAAGELAVFTDGRILKVDDAVLVGDTIVLSLPGGGELEVSAMRIERVVDDEVAAAPAPASRPTPRCPASFTDEGLPGDLPFAELIADAARSADLNPRLLAAVVRAESAFDPYAVSRAGARGLTQLMPATAADEGVLDPFDPAANLNGGARHLRGLVDRFDSLPLALAAYNAGAATVERHGGIPPYRETQSYVTRVLEEFCGP